MAVCGRCWICGSKFECRELESCGDCTEHKPLRTYRDESCGDCTEHKPLRTYRDGVWGYFICGRCERDVESGGLGALIEAVRAAKGEE